MTRSIPARDRRSQAIFSGLDSSFGAGSGYRRRRDCNQHHRSPGTPSPASPGGRPPND